MKGKLEWKSEPETKTVRGYEVLAESTNGNVFVVWNPSSIKKYGYIRKYFFEQLGGGFRAISETKDWFGNYMEALKYAGHDNDLRIER